MKKLFVGLVLGLVLVGVFVSAATTEQAFNIQKGWSLVTYSVIENLPENSITDDMYVFYLNPESKKYIGGRVKDSNTWSEMGISEADTLLDIYGFWFYAPQTIKINFPINNEAGIGNEIKDISQVDTHLYKGWNFLGIDDIMFDKSLSQIKGTCDFESVYLYPNDENGWLELKGEQLGSPFIQRMAGKMDFLGSSFAIKVKDECKLDFQSLQNPNNIPPGIPNNNADEECTKVLYSGDSSEKVDIVFISDSYTNLDLWTSDVNSFTDVSSSEKGLFSVEPMKSNKEKFNVWRLNELNLKFWNIAQGEGSILSGEANTALRNLAEKCTDYDYIVLIKDNSDGSISAGWAPKDDLIFVTRLNDFDNLRTEAMLHEFGHAFADLGDEYETGTSLTDYSDRANIDIEACPKWCDGELNQDSFCYEDYISFKECLLSTTNNLEDSYPAYACDLGTVWDLENPCNLGKNCREGTGCYFNAKSLINFKSSIGSLMNQPEVGPFEFNLISREAIQNELNKFN